MPITPTYPGVYIEEIPSGVRTITGVATSIAAFIDYFPKGLMNKAVQIFNMGDFEREFGGLDVLSEGSYAIQQFFLNGGTEAWVIRTASGNVDAATVEIKSSIGGAPALTVEAGRLDPDTHPELTNPGTWGNNLRVNIDYPTPVSGDRFNMTISLVNTISGQQVIVRSEVFNNLSMDSAASNFVARVVNDEFSGSKLVRVRASGNARPLQTGTVSGELVSPIVLSNPTPQLLVSIGNEGQGIATLPQSGSITIQQARDFLESAIRAVRPDIKAFAQAAVSIVDNQLRILAGPTRTDSRVTFASATDPAITALGLSSGTTNLAGLISGNLNGVFGSFSGALEVAIGSSNPITINLNTVSNLGDASTELEARIRAESGNQSDPADADAFLNVRVVPYTFSDPDPEERLIVLAGLPNRSVSFTPAGGDTLVTTLGLDGATATPITAIVSTEISPIPTVPDGSLFEVTIGSNGPHTAETVAVQNTLDGIAAELETAIRRADPASSPGFMGSRVAAYSPTTPAGPNRLVVIAGAPTNTVNFAQTSTDDPNIGNPTISQLRLDTASGAVTNLQSYALGAGAEIPNTAQGVATPGNDGTPPDGQALTTGIQVLENVDLFNILCIPRTAIRTGNNSLTPPEITTVINTAINFCEDQRAFLIIDTPTGIDEVQDVKDWFDSSGIPRSKNAALYFPRVQIPDPLNDFKLKCVGASGTIAGLYARTDSDRGVWKAPAGTEALLRNVFQLDVSLTDPQNGTLNKVAINCLRTFPIYGTICWGARTLEGADDIGSEWKYLPVRRTALFIEETLYRELKWVVFEPNDESLWAQIRLNVGAFMNNLFRQGAFQGRTPREAYLVKCDKETTTQNDIDRGIVNILVGFAPLKPAEFVFIKLQQLAGQIQT
jgi:phage tail sheath protein FI